MPIEKIKSILPTGPDVAHGGDGLPDWMQFTVTILQFILFRYSDATMD